MSKDSRIWSCNQYLTPLSVNWTRKDSAVTSYQGKYVFVGVAVGVLREKSDKNGHLLGFVPHKYFSLLSYLLMFVPRLELLFFMNHYFILCICMYRKSTRIFSLKILM